MEGWTVNEEMQMDTGEGVEPWQGMHPEPPAHLPLSCFRISPRKKLELEKLETFTLKENKGTQAFKDYTHPVSFYCVDRCCLFILAR